MNEKRNWFSLKYLIIQDIKAVITKLLQSKICQSELYIENSNAVNLKTYC